MLAARRINISPTVADIIPLEDFPYAFKALKTPSHQCKVLTLIK